jgi:zinc protease
MSARRVLLVLALLGASGFGATPVAARLALPPVTRATLKNGLTVLVMPTRRLPLVDFRLVVRAGAVNDPHGKEGVASLMTDLLTQGAGRRNAQQIAEDIAFVGGTLEAAAGSEQTIVACEVLKKDFDTGLEMFRDVIVSPTFPAAEFERKKQETLGAIASAKDDPGTVAGNELGPFLLADHPLAHPPIGWEKTVKTIGRDDIVAFHTQFVRPDHAILAVVGDIEPKTLIAALERAFAAWKPAGEPIADAYTAPAQVHGRQVRIVSMPEVTQTQIRFACIGVPRSTPDFYPIVVANSILGGGFTSRLVNELRVNQGLTYDISSRFGMYRNAGTFTVSTFTKNATIRKTIDATLAEMNKLKDKGPTEEELDKARKYVTGQYPLGLQAPDDLAAQLASVEFYGLPPDYLETFSDKINAVTMADVRRVLKTYVCTDDLRILVVSNPDLAKKVLTGLAPAEVREPQ